VTEEAWLGFRLRLRARLLEAAGVSSVGLALATACGGRADSANPGGVGHVGGAGADGSLSNGGAGQINAGGGVIITSEGGATGQPLHACLARTGVDGGLAFSPTLPVAASDAGMAGASDTSDTGAALDVAACPVGAAVPPLFEQCTRNGALEVLSVNGGPVVENGQCCYDLLAAHSFCGYVGRAFLVEGDMIKARARSGGGWTQQLAPRLDRLSPATRRALADEWLKDGLFEHASVATFSRFAIQLLSVGAPARLLHDTLAAGRDEVRHAELCFALASAYAGEPLEPDNFPVDATLPIDRALAAIVAETVVEGCIGETLAALQARAQLDVATDPAVRAALEVTVEDETRHAELAWKVVAWAVHEGGPSVRMAAQRAFTEFRAPAPPTLELDDVNSQHFAAHGRLTPERARAVALEALESVVKPCAAGLLEHDVFLQTACTPSLPA
jgi:hypothetical protein